MELARGIYVRNTTILSSSDKSNLKYMIKIVINFDLDGSTKHPKTLDDKQNCIRLVSPVIFKQRECFKERYSYSSSSWYTYKTSRVGPVDNRPSND